MIHLKNASKSIVREAKFLFFFLGEENFIVILKLWKTSYNLVFIHIEGNLTFCIDMKYLLGVSYCE